MAPLELSVSFASRSSADEKQALNSVSAAFGVTIKNFEKARVTLRALRAFHVLGSA